MPQADQVFTVQLVEPPTGIFSEISTASRHRDLIDVVHSRLDEISAMLFLMKNSEEISRTVATALCGLETAVNDAAALLSVRSGGVL